MNYKIVGSYIVLNVFLKLNFTLKIPAFEGEIFKKFGNF